MPSIAKTGAWVASPRLIESKDRPKEKPASAPEIGPSKRDQGNNHKIDHDGPKPFKESQLGAIQCKKGTAIADAIRSNLDLKGNLIFNVFELGPNQ